MQVPFDGFDVEIIDLEAPSELVMYSDVRPILNYAFENRSEIKVAQKNIESAELAREISKSGFYPTFSFSYGLNAASSSSMLASCPLWRIYISQKHQTCSHSTNSNTYLRRPNRCERE